MRWFLPLAALFVLILPEAVMAQQATIPLVTTTPNANGGSDYALGIQILLVMTCLLYTSPSPRDLSTSRMPSSA